MFTTAAIARTFGAARLRSADVVVAPGVCATTTITVAEPWHRHVGGFGFPVDHKRPARQPPSIVS